MKKRKKPQKGDFIDLEKTDFKKKNNIFAIVIRYLIFGIIFFGLGIFINQKYRLPFDLNIQNTLGQKSENKILSEFKNNLKLLEDDIERVTSKIKNSNESFENIEKKNRQLISKLNEISERVSEVDEFDYSKSFKKQLNQYELLKNFIVLKNKFEKRQKITNEISDISGFFDEDFTVLTLLNFFNEIDFVDIVKEDYLLEEINEKIKRYDFKLEDFFEEVKGKTNLKSNDIFNSKKEFFEYVNEIFSSTFKITKYKDENFNESVKEIGNYREVLLLSKEYLIIGNVSKAIQIIEQSALDLNDLENWLEKGNELIKVKSQMEKLEELILQRLVNYNG